MHNIIQVFLVYPSHTITDAIPSALFRITLLIFRLIYKNSMYTYLLFFYTMVYLFRFHISLFRLLSTLPTYHLLIPRSWRPTCTISSLRSTALLMTFLPTSSIRHSTIPLFYLVAGSFWSGLSWWYEVYQTSTISSNLPCSVAQYWHTLGCAVTAKERWSLACNWLADRSRTSTELAAAVDEVHSSLEVHSQQTIRQLPCPLG